jgi:hypothetical protein
MEIKDPTADLPIEARQKIKSILDSAEVQAIAESKRTGKPLSLNRFEEIAMQSIKDAFSL